MPPLLLNADGFPPLECRGGAISVGNFDGVHRGHAELLAQTRAVAAEVHGPSVVMTFDPHPICLLAPERRQPSLTTIHERAEQLQSLGIDQVVALRTTPALLALTPEEFFRDILQTRFQIRGMVEGFNFRFGKNRAGSNELLQPWCAAAGIAFRVVPPLADADGPISSSRIRDALIRGDIAAAARLLNHPYRITGRVGVGAQRGRTIGFPTANLQDVETLLPGEGVYAVRLVIDGQQYAAAANIGPNPTFGEDARKIEVHVIDFQGNLYGRELTVEFTARLRAVQRFGSVAELVIQLQRDITAVKEMEKAR